MTLGNIILGDTSKVGLSNKISRHAWIHKTLASIPENETILDAGAGECQFKEFCSHLKYTSQDFGQYDGSGDGKGIQTGVWNNTKLDIVSDITNIPVPDNSFRNIMCIEVLEHLPDPVAALKELVRILEPGGKIILTAPFTSLTHFAPYHFATGFNKYFYKHWSEKLNLKVKELSFNGNYFEFLAQELRYSQQVSDIYTNKKMNLLERIALKKVLSWMQKTSIKANGSEELLAFGIHFIGEKAAK